MTKALPLSEGRCCRSSIAASKPPAEPPMPTIGQTVVCFLETFGARRRRFSFAGFDRAEVFRDFAFAATAYPFSGTTQTGTSIEWRDQTRRAIGFCPIGIPVR